MMDEPVNNKNDKSRKPYRACFVPLCPNTTLTEPEKLYFSMPTDMDLRKKWFDRAHCKGPIGKRNYYCCEDHFVLSEDMLGYMEFKMMGRGRKIQLKKNVIPHLFQCQNRKTGFSPMTNRSASIILERKRLITKILQEEETKKQDASVTTQENAEVAHCGKHSNNNFYNGNFKQEIIENAQQEPNFERILVEEYQENYSETTYSVQGEHSSCELNFTTAKQLNDHTFWCKKKNKSDGIMFNVDLKKEVLNIDNVEIQQKKQNIEQVLIKIEDTLEKIEMKKEINEELIIKDEPFDTHDDIFKCDTCELVFDTEIQLISHTSWRKRKKRSIGTSNPTQNYCSSINRSESLKTSTHSKKKLHSVEEAYECDDCKRSFKYKSALIYHNKIYHTGYIPFACTVCKKEFTYRKDFWRHKRTCIGENPFKCDVCSKSFRFRSTLINHELIHTGEKPFVCDVCTKAYKDKGSLNRHKLNHTGEKPFKCYVCEKTFSIRCMLTEHERIHTGEKPYECDVCQRSFRQKGSFTQHKYNHTREKQFACDVCNKKFTQKGYLHKHKLIHNAVKCDICNRKFRSKRNLNRHKRKHTSSRS